MSKLRREAWKVPEVDVAYLGIITAIVWLSVSLPTLGCISADAGYSHSHLQCSPDYICSKRRYYILFHPRVFNKKQNHSTAFGNKSCWAADSLITWREATRHCERMARFTWTGHHTLSDHRQEKREINISLQASETPRASLMPRQHALETRASCKPIGSLQSPTLPSDNPSLAPTHTLLSGPGSPSARSPGPSPCNPFAPQSLQQQQLCC